MTLADRWGKSVAALDKELGDIDGIPEIYWWEAYFSRNEALLTPIDQISLLATMLDPRRRSFDDINPLTNIRKGLRILSPEEKAFHQKRIDDWNAR